MRISRLGSLLGIIIATLGIALSLDTASAGTSQHFRNPAAASDITDTPHAAPASSDLAAGSTVRWNGEEWNVSGVNVPWYHWSCDFGCGSGSHGVSSADSQARLAEGFAQIEQAGVHAVRWWMFEGSGWQIQRDAGGAPTGLDPRVYEDIDAALELAEQYDLVYNFVFFDLAGGAEFPSSWLTDPDHREALAEVLGELAARYVDHPRILAWEIFNEPEWAIWDGKVDRGAAIETARAIAQELNAASSTYVTLGSAMLDGLSMWTHVGLDYYQAHWYDYMSSGAWCARCRSYDEVRAEHGLDGPLVIGEFYAGSNVDAQQRFADFDRLGYAGAWAWSLFPERTQDKMSIDLAALGDYAQAAGDVGPSSGTSANPEPTASPEPTAEPTPEPTPSPQPTASPTPSPTPSATPSPTPEPSPTAVAADYCYNWNDKGYGADPRQWRGNEELPPPYFFLADPFAAVPATLPHGTAGGDVHGVHPATSIFDYAFTASPFAHLMLRAPQDGYSEVGQRFPDVPLENFDLRWDQSLHGVNGREWMAVVIQPADSAVPNPIGSEYAVVVQHRADPPVVPPPGSLYINTRVYNGFTGWNGVQIGGGRFLHEWEAYPWQESSDPAQAAWAADIREATAHQRIRLPHRLQFDVDAGTLTFTMAGRSWTKPVDLSAYESGVSVMLMSVNYNAAKDGGSLGGWAWHIGHVCTGH